MIIEVQQLTRGAEKTYKCFDHEGTICDVYSPYQYKETEFYFEFTRKGKQVMLHWGNKDIPFWKNPAARLTMQIMENGLDIGGIVSDEACVTFEKEGRHHGEVGIYHITHRGRKYDAFVDSVPHDEDFICIFDENHILQAEIRRTRLPYKDYDYYVAFTEDESLDELLCLIAVYIDFAIFTHRGEMDEGVYTNYNCINGKQYHDAGYIKQIAEKEGFDLSKKVDIQMIESANVQKCREAIQKGEPASRNSRMAYKTSTIAILLLFVVQLLKFLIDMF